VATNGSRYLPATASTPPPRSSTGECLLQPISSGPALVCLLLELSACCPDTKPQPLARLIWRRPWMSVRWPGGPPVGRTPEPDWIPGTPIDWGLFMNQERMDMLVNVDGALDPILPSYMILGKESALLTSYMVRWPVDPNIVQAWREARRQRTLAIGGGGPGGGGGGGDGAGAGPPPPSGGGGAASRPPPPSVGGGSAGVSPRGGRGGGGSPPPIGGGPHTPDLSV
jgi:hypothetical protein